MTKFNILADNSERYYRGTYKDVRSINDFDLSIESSWNFPMLNDPNVTDEELLEIIEGYPYYLTRTNEGNRIFEAEGVNAGTSIIDIELFTEEGMYIYEFEGKYLGWNLAKDGLIIKPQKLISRYVKGKEGRKEIFKNNKWIELKGDQIRDLSE
jgi:hypothetical protein